VSGSAVALNITNVPRPLYNQLLELKGKLHARTWVEVLQYAVQDPEGQIDFEIFSAGLWACPKCGQPTQNQEPKNIHLTFRSGNFVYAFDGRQPKDQQYASVSNMAGVGVNVTPIQVRNHAKNR
jgi:hypothetical protein